MKRTLLAVFAIGLGLLYLLKVTSEGGLSLEEKSTKVGKAPSVKADLVSKALITGAGNIDKGTSPKDPLIKDYQTAAYALAHKIEKLGLDGEELNELFNRVGKENFLKHVPKEIRGDYLNLEEKIAALRSRYVSEDGMTESFFTRYQVQMPQWLEDHRKELEEVQLPATVSDLVNKKIQETAINNDDINEILTGCGKGNVPCINRAFALLIDANHGLDDSQLKMIQEYL